MPLMSRGISMKNDLVVLAKILIMAVSKLNHYQNLIK
jgi:hypothetical protein